MQIHQPQDSANNRVFRGANGDRISSIKNYKPVGLVKTDFHA